jgi:hypothetical protein
LFGIERRNDALYRVLAKVNFRKPNVAFSAGGLTIKENEPVSGIFLV